MIKLPQEPVETACILRHIARNGDDRMSNALGVGRKGPRRQEEADPATLPLPAFGLTEDLIRVD